MNKRNREHFIHVPPEGMGDEETVSLGLFCSAVDVATGRTDRTMPVGGARGDAGDSGATGSLSSLTVELLDAHQSQISDISKKQELLEAMKVLC